MWNYPVFSDTDDDVIAEFRSIPKNSVQVLFLGSSHVSFGITPAELYKNHGITAFNLGTSAQGLDSSHLFLLEAFRTQRPRVVVVDLSFLCRRQTVANRKIAPDLTAFGRNKLRFALARGNGRSIRKNLAFLPERWKDASPMYQYHTRWKDLTGDSFERFLPRNHFLFGHNVYTIANRNWDWANGWRTAPDDLAQRMAGRNVIRERAFAFGAYDEAENAGNPLYAPEVDEGARCYLISMRDECAKRGARLVLTKLPVFNNTVYYAGTWTREKHDRAVGLSRELGVDFVDCVYDADTGVDFSTDTTDGGAHMNLLGARKTTEFWGRWLESHFDLPKKRLPEFDAKIPLYERLMEVADLQLERDFCAYLDRLNSSSHDLALFFAVADTALAESTDGEKVALNSIGFRTDFSGAGYADSFIGIIDGGNVVYECLSNREQNCEYRLEPRKVFGLNSSGGESGSRASVRLNGKELALNWRGLNVVVYDKKEGLVLDSVCFDFWDAGNRQARRNDPRQKEQLLAYCRSLTEEKR